MKIEAVFFDFDGVILDSVSVKTKAFAEMFRHYGPDIEDKVVKYHLENGGVSRFDKFRYYYEELLNKPITEDKIQELSKKFSNLVVIKVIKSEFVKGAMETLSDLLRNNIPTYIVSGTPDAEIRMIVEKKRLSKFFDEVHGSPQKKWDITMDILNRKGYTPQNCFFLGDAMSDYKAAQETGLQFIGVVKKGKVSPFPTGTTLYEFVPKII